MPHRSRCSAWILLTTCRCTTAIHGLPPYFSSLANDQHLTNTLFLSFPVMTIFVLLSCQWVPGTSVTTQLFSEQFSSCHSTWVSPMKQVLAILYRLPKPQYTVSECQNNAHKKITHAGNLKCYMSLSFPKKKLELFGFCSSKHFQQQICLLD